MIAGRRQRGLETLEDEDIWYEANARSDRDLLWLGIGAIVVVLVDTVRGLRIARAVSREIKRRP